ncbi:fimbria/pilus outer membrane usher protein [Lysobacter sp. FW306-1B-D06B]|uniref:fimbria/pilus outer membrane usher protein n=1 Tax=Lysobacter sp. FW306-1B-D06B TaxID=3140250 RepID=UPI00314054A4
MASSASRYGKESTASISASRSMDYDRGGFGWSALLDGGDDGYRHGMGRVDYRGTYGDASLLLEHSTRDDFTYTNATLFATGALVWMDGDLLASRTISDAFAVVSTNGMADIPILRENRLVGATNREGHLLIPDLLSWQSNRLMLGTVELPPDVRVDADRMEVAPRGLSGVLAAFPVGRYTGAVVILVDERGQPLPVGTTVTVTDSGLTATMGYDGQVFIEQLGPRQTVSAEANDATCTAEVLFDAADVLTTIGPFVCKSSQVLP